MVRFMTLQCELGIRIQNLHTENSEIKAIHRNIQTIKWKQLTLNLAVIEYTWALPLGYRTLGQTIK